MTFRRAAVIRIVGCCLLTFMLAGVVEWLFSRIAAGHLFLWSCPGDAPASLLERQDAIASARQWRLAAACSVAVIGVLIFYGTTRPRLWSRSQPPGWGLLLLVIATVLDCLSTLWFFHTQSIALEIHPGIRLFGYAFGRTTGPILAKAIQCAGIVLVGSAVPAWRLQLYVTAAILMLLAAAHNMHITFYPG